MTLAITAPGMYDLTNAEYHADPVEGGSLSSTGARTILRSAAHYRHQLDNPKPSTEDMMFGSAVHTLVLGAGDEIEVIDAEDYKTKAAREAKAAALKAGKIPLLPGKYSVAEAMAEVVHNHPTAAELLTEGKAEQALVWRSHGIWRRALVDYLRPDGAVDYKTTTSCELVELARTVYKYGYHQQASWYLDGICALGLCSYPEFRFIFQEKEPPYAVRVVTLDFDAVGRGETANLEAMRRFRECRALEEWPAYPEHAAVISLPAYARKESE